MLTLCCHRDSLHEDNRRGGIDHHTLLFKPCKTKLTYNGSIKLIYSGKPTNLQVTNNANLRRQWTRVERKPTLSPLFDYSRAYYLQIKMNEKSQTSRGNQLYIVSFLDCTMHL